MNGVVKLGVGILFYSILSKMWFFLMVPGRFVLRWVGFGSAAGWSGVMILLIMLGHGVIKTTVHAARNVYIEAFVPERAPVPLFLKHDLNVGLRVQKSTSYMDTSVSMNGILHMTVTNNTKYPLTKLWFVCKVHGALYADDVETVNTGYLFDGVMPPGQTRSTDVVFEGPSGGSYMTECKLGGAEIPYGWWEGIPRQDMERREGHGPARRWNPETFRVEGEGTQGRKRMFLDDELRPTTDPMDGVTDKSPIWEVAGAAAAPAPEARITMTYEASVDTDGVLLDLTVVNNRARAVADVPILCLIQTNDGVVERRVTAFPMGVGPGGRASDSALIEDITSAKAIACELGE